MNTKRGILFVACGEKYVEEAKTAIASCRAHLSAYPIALVTDSKNVPAGLVDLIIPLEKPEKSFAVKIQPLINTPFEETLFLDTDVLVCEPCDEIFAPLERYDLAIAHDPYRTSYKIETLPVSIPMPNTGVIVYKRTEGVLRMFRRWEERHRTHFGKYHGNDQPAFREVMFESNIRHFILPPEYNLRTFFPSMIGGHLDVKIIHEHTPYLHAIARTLKRAHGAGAPTIYGRLKPALVWFYYFTKVRRVLNRWFTKRP